jgi:CBS domain containing-hemolysin-like protein
LTDADYQELVEFAFQQGNLARSARDIILQIVNLDRRTVQDVMQPRAKMAAIPDDLSLEDMIAAARQYAASAVADV